LNDCSVSAVTYLVVRVCSVVPSAGTDCWQPCRVFSLSRRWSQRDFALRVKFSVSRCRRQSKILWIT